MRIAYLINQYPKVSHSFIRREILALERQGVEVQRIALRGWDADLADEEDFAERGRTRYVLQDGMRGVLRATIAMAIAAPGRFFAGLRLALKMSRRADRSLPYHLIYFAEGCCVAYWLRETGTTHLHAHFGTNSAEVAMLAAEVGGFRYSMTIHGSEEFDKPEFIGLGEKIRRASFVAAVTSYCRSQLYRAVELAHWNKVHVVHCGLEPAFHRDATGATDAAPAIHPRFVCVGRLCEQKAQQLLVEAVAMLARKGVTVELVLAGDGEMRSDVEVAIARHQLQQHVRITGWISGEQVREELLQSRALVMASFAEGLPVVIMEAMSLRRPVLTTWITGIPELVREGESGWLYPPGSVEELADAMERCLSTPDDELLRMGERARQRVLERHDIDREAAKLVTLFWKAEQDSLVERAAQRMAEAYR